MKICCRCKVAKNETEFYARKTAKDGLRGECKACNRLEQLAWHKTESGKACIKKYFQYKSNEIVMIERARARAKKLSIPCTIKECDVVIPEYCPILGIALIVGGTGTNTSLPGSASLDRINPELGYIPGNVQVISYKANRMKNDATLKELKAFAAWVVNQNF